MPNRTRTKRKTTKDGVTTVTKIKSVYKPKNNKQKVKRKVVTKSKGVRSVKKNKFKM